MHGDPLVKPELSSVACEDGFIQSSRAAGDKMKPEIITELKTKLAGDP